ncbi:MAG: hypothetical protein OHK0052_13430 [Anaerolineales bacterium]
MQTLRPLLNNSALRIAAGVGVALIALWLAIRAVDLAQVFAALQAANWLWVIAALLSVCLNVAAKVIRWRVLLGQSGLRTRWRDLLAALLVGQTLNWMLPGRAGDLSRAYTIGRLGAGSTFTLGTDALEKVFDTVAYALLFLFLLIVLPLPAWMADSGLTFGLLSVLMVGGVLLVAFFPAAIANLLSRLTLWLPEKIQLGFLQRLRAGFNSLAVIRQRAPLIQIAFWTLLVWITALLNNALILQALAIHTPWTASLAVLVVLQAGISLPSSPGRIGVFQYLCILALAWFDVSQTDGLTYGILLQAVVFLPPTLLSLPFFAAPTRRMEQP